MAYTDVAEVKRSLRKLPSSVTDNEINVFIAKGDAIIDSVLGIVFMIPLAIPPQIVKNISTDLAVFYLAESFYTSQQPNLDEVYTKRYERAMKQLNDIATGDLFVEMPKRPPEEQFGYASTNDREPDFDLETEW